MRDGRLRAASVALMSALAFLPPSAARAVPTMAAIDAAARAGGNRKAVAIAIGRAMFETTWPAQITKIRVDGVGPHEVAGIIVSAVKFKRPLTLRQFEAEVAEIERVAFAASDVEEVDLQAVEPLALRGTPVVSGDLAVPTFRIVYAETALRDKPVERAAARAIFIAPEFARRIPA